MNPAAKLQPAFREPAATYEEILSQQAAAAGRASPSAFQLRAQLLDQGRSETVLAAGTEMTVRLKVYASGGENALHAHANEDHVFIILQGSAQFRDADGVLAELSRNSGIMIPKGSYYCFNATSGEPLVMLRIGAPNESAKGIDGRVDVHGAFAHADAAANKTVPVKFRAGSFFGDAEPQ